MPRDRDPLLDGSALIDSVHFIASGHRIGIRSAGHPCVLPGHDRSDDERATPVMCLHGPGGSRTAWDSVLMGLSGPRWAFAWDLFGYGESDLQTPLSFAAIADGVAGLLDALDIEQIHLVGLSFGGQQAQHVALRHPERIRSLVLADTSAVFGADGTDVDEWKRLRLDPLDQGVHPAEMAVRVLRSIVADGFTEVPEHQREFDRAVAAFARITPAGLRAAVECLPTHDTRANLGAITVPTTVIVGELDTETPPAYAELLAASIPYAVLRTIPGAGHLTPTENPAVFLELLEDHLHRVETGVPPDEDHQWNGK